MLRITDNTLTGMDSHVPPKEDVLAFCQLLFQIGVDEIEVSVPVMEILCELPFPGKFILFIRSQEDVKRYGQFQRYVMQHAFSVENVIPIIHIHDTREIRKICPISSGREIRVEGLDGLFCDEYDKQMKELVKFFPNTRIQFSPGNTYTCASALVTQWLLDHGREAVTSFAGYRNNAATEEVLMALRIITRHKPNQDLTVLPTLRFLFEKMTGLKVSNKKPVIGKHIFKVESGIHADGLQKNRAIYEAYHPECVGGMPEIVIGKHSGMKAVKYKLEELKLPIPEEEVIKNILAVVKEVCVQSKKSLKDQEFMKIALEVMENETGKAYCGHNTEGR